MPQIVAGITVVLGIGIWIAAAFIALGALKDFGLWFSKPQTKIMLGKRALEAVVIAAALTTWFYLPLREFFSEAVGIAVTVVLLDQFAIWRAYNTEKHSVIRQMASRSNDFALDAVRVAHQERWLRDGSLRGADLSEANLYAAIMPLADLRAADLSFAILENARITAADLRGITGFEVNFSKTILRYCILDDADLERASFVQTYAEHVYLQRAHLVGADFRGAILFKAKLNGANLTRVSFLDARLSEVDLSDAILEEVYYNEKTIWPDNFHVPSTAILVETQSTEGGRYWPGHPL